jgi:hypothetical protein
MGCEIVVEGASARELARIRSLFEERDAVFSRFRPDSELNRVNAAGAERSSRRSSRGWSKRRSGPARRPAASSTRPSSRARGRGLRPRVPRAGTQRPARHCATPGSVVLYGRVLVLRGRLDLNGVVKAAAVDDALRLLSGPGFVSAGGDLAANTPLDVGLPGGGSVRLLVGALATSGRTKRRWLRRGREQHHLIDPSTGRPSAARGRRSPSAGRPASLPTSRPRRPSCSATRARSGWTSAPCPAASSPPAASTRTRAGATRPRTAGAAARRRRPDRSSPRPRA